MSTPEILESDRLGIFPHPREADHLIGQQDAEQALLDAFVSGRMQHAWLLTGPKGVGKATLAYRMARFVLEHGDAERAAAMRPNDLSVAVGSRSFQQVLAGSHPNLITVRRPYDDKTKKLKTVITVDEVRRIGHFFGLTASERGAWRIVIIDSADEMNANAANALLKALEEPPARCLFLLLSHQPGRLLPTIRSRCRLLHLKPLSQENIQGVMNVAEEKAAIYAHEAGEKFVPTSAADRQAIAQLADGSAGRALSIAASGGLGLYRELSALLSGLPRLDVAAIHGFADKAGRKGADDTYETMMELLSYWLQRLVRVGAGVSDGYEIVPGEGAAMARLTSGGSLDRWVEVWEKVGQISLRGEALNTDRKLVILNVFSMLEAVAGSQSMVRA